MKHMKGRLDTTRHTRQSCIHSHIYRPTCISAYLSQLSKIFKNNFDVKIESFLIITHYTYPIIYFAKFMEQLHVNV